VILKRLVLLAVLLSPAAAFAQTRPLLTEEATTAPAHAWALETGADVMAREPNYETGHTRSRIEGPLLRVVYSPSDAAEMDLQWVARVVTPSDPDFGSVSDWGDVTLRAKLRLYDGKADGPTVGARFAVTLPETSYGQGLGPNTLRMSAQALLSQAAGPWRFHLNGGVAIEDEVFRAHEQRDFLAYGLAAEWRVAAGLALLTEVAGRSGKGAAGTDAHGEWRGGVRVTTGRLQWDAALRRGLADADGTWGATAGLAWRTR
jgi:hypothetical protein